MSDLTGPTDRSAGKLFLEGRWRFAIVSGVIASIIASGLYGIHHETIERWIRELWSGAPCSKLDASDGYQRERDLHDQATKALALRSQVREAGQCSWQEAIDVKPGDRVEWVVKVTNWTDDRQTNVVASVLTAPHTSLVPGSGRWYNSHQPKGVELDLSQLIIDNGNGGFTFGNYAPKGGGFLISFASTVGDDFESCATRAANVAHVKSDQVTDELSVSASVYIGKRGC